MKKRVLKLFTLLLVTFFQSNYLSATPECPIISGKFNQPDGTTVDASATGWYLDASHVASTGYFAVKSSRLHAQELGGEGIWYSRVFSTAGYSDFQVAVKVTAEGDMNSSEYVKIYYKINGGAETLLDSRTGNFGTIDFTSGTLTGSNVQLIVKIYNYNNGGSQTSKYYIEEYRVFKEKGPCAVSAITVTGTAGNGGVLTCSTPSIALGATATGSGTTTYSWTGPNGFTSTAQNPTVSTAGAYTVVATNSSGTGSTTVTVTENKTPPTVTATGGTLACGSSVTLNATSSVSGSTFSWTGPNSFTSTTQNPTVSTAGTYTVTVTNPANGCTASATATVSGSATASVFWLEDFAGLANGTTSDAGATAWTATTSGTGTYSVQNNEFKTSFSGQSEGVWTSQSIDISSKSSVTFSVDLRSETASSSDAFETSDYVRVYYKLNGGTATLLYEDLAGIGTTTSGTASITVTSAALSGSTLQIIIKTNNSDPTERYYFDNIKVSGINSGSSSVSISQTGSVTCTATAQLQATASSTATAYAWTGPNGFTSAVQNPTVSAGGTYVVTATLSSGCTVSGAITVPENKTAPDITASGGSLGCLSTIRLNVSSTVSGAMYSWTGPNSFTSTSQNPSVSTAGTYTATVTNPANGCTTSQAVSVTAGATTATSFWVEDFSGLANGTTSDAGTTAWTATTSGSGTYSVQNNEFKTSFSGQSEGVWTSQAIDITGKSNVSFSVDLRSETASTSDVFETSDYVRVYYKLNGGAETLVYEDQAGIGTTTSGTASITVTSAAVSGSILQIIIKTNNSDPTERYYFDNIKVTGSTAAAESATATANGAITCTTGSVTLLGSSASSGVTYSWTGPNNYTSTAQNPVVTTAGIYTLTVYNPSTGCSGTDTALVALNNTAPVASITQTGAITCNTGSTVTLSANSSASDVTYSWTGPGNFTATAQSIAVSATGAYAVTITNPANGCTGSTNTTVVQTNTFTGTQWLEDFTLPDGTTVDNGPTAWSVTYNPSTTLFSVLNNEFRISNSSTTGEGVWRSAVIDVTGRTNISISADVRSSIINNAVMNSTGQYADYLRFYYVLNNGAEVLFDEKLGIINNHSTTPTNISVSGLGGATSLQIVVRARATGNDEFYYIDNVKVVSTSAVAVNAGATGGAINCINPNVTLQGTTTSTGATYAWSGPNNYTSTVQNPTVTTAGTYTFTVTAGNCTASAAAVVTADTTHPAAVITNASGISQLTCTNASVAITGSSNTSGVSYQWSGPGNYTATTAAAVATQGGSYVLTVTNPANGCTGSNTVVFTENKVHPLATATSNNAITCRRATTDLKGTSTTAGVSFNWAGPNGFSAGTANVTTGIAGNYTLTVTDPTNGCQGQIAITVIQDTTKPVAAASNDGPISCATPEVTLTGSSAISGLTYFWTGPNGFSSSAQIAGNITNAGTYTLTVTDNRSTGNGCSAQYTTNVIEDFSDCAARVATTGTGTTSTAASTPAAGNASTVTYRAYPNPVSSGNAVIEFTLPQQAPVTVALYNALGACEKLLYKGNAAANQLYKLPVPAALKTGAYYYIISTNSRSYNGKLVIVH
jgi:hypothetical protein